MIRGSRCARARLVLVILVSALGIVSLARPILAAGYKTTDLVSDAKRPHVPKTDPHLDNPWGLVTTHDGLLVTADNDSGLGTFYKSNGNPLRTFAALPTPAGVAGPSAPTGVVMNHTNAFLISSGTQTLPSEFLFATEEGTIIGYNQNLNSSNALIVVNNSTNGAVYKGLARARNATGVFLYAANFHAGTIDVFSSTFAPTTLAGSFTDPNLPDGFAPFGIRHLDGDLFVTYAKQDVDKLNDAPGPGNGLVNVFNTDGQFLRRLTSPGGVLNSPWGLALAPDRFGQFSHAILVGNFGDGRIQAFDPANGTYLGQLATRQNQPIVIDGLWGLAFGRRRSGASPALDEQEDLNLTNFLYFSSRPARTPPPAHEYNGLLGLIRPDPASGKVPHTP